MFVYRTGVRHPLWKGGKPKCLDCNKQLKGSYAKRCLSCAGKAKTFSKQHRQNLSRALMGIKRPNLLGSNNHAWKGGVTPLHRKLRTSFEYEDWRRKVFERDDYSCQECGDRGAYLHADHIKRFADYPELRFEVSNGQTLCIECHRVKTIEEGKKYWKNQFDKSSYYIKQMKGGVQ